MSGEQDEPTLKIGNEGLELKGKQWVRVKILAFVVLSIIVIFTIKPLFENLPELKIEHMIFSGLIVFALLGVLIFLVRKLY